MNGPFVPIEDLSKHFSVSVSTIRGWVRKGHIPKNTYIKVGNTYRFSIADVSEALTQQHNDVVSFNEALGVDVAQITVDGLEAQAEVDKSDEHWADMFTAPIDDDV
jgi:excisionase family DNA binding protein